MTTITSASIDPEEGRGRKWMHHKDSFVALIVLLDQFSRHIYRGTASAFKNDGPLATAGIDVITTN